MPLIRPSHKLKQHVILGLGPTGTVRLDDLHDCVEQRRSLSVPSSGELSLNPRHVGGMTCMSDTLEPLDRLVVPQAIDRKRRVEPSQNEAAFRRPEATPQDIVEGVQMTAPLVP